MVGGDHWIEAVGRGWEASERTGCWVTGSRLEVSLGGTGRYLGEEELPKLCVLDDSACQAQGDYVSKSLDLMDHCLCVGHLGPVLKLGLPVLANRLVNLLVDFGCGRRGRYLGIWDLRAVMIVQICTSMCDMDLDHSEQTLAICIVGAASLVHLVLPESQRGIREEFGEWFGEQAVDIHLTPHGSYLPISSDIFIT